MVLYGAWCTILSSPSLSITVSIYFKNLLAGEKIQLLWKYFMFPFFTFCL